MKLPKRVRAFNKAILNRIVSRFAGRSNTPFVLLYHVGRRSGKPYATPLIAVRHGNGFIFALTYGPEVDWYRNVVAANGGRLLWHGRDYALAHVTPIDPTTALPAFAQPWRTILRVIGIQEFVRMEQAA